MTSQIATSETNSPAVARLADLQERIQHNERRMLAIDKELAEIDTDTSDAPAIESAVLSFDPIWEAMTLRDQIRLINMIVKRVDYDGEVWPCHHHIPSLLAANRKLSSRPRIFHRCNHVSRKTSRHALPQETRRQADRVVRRQSPPAQTPSNRPFPRITRYMALAIYYEDLIRKGHVP